MYTFFHSDLAISLQDIQQDIEVSFCVQYEIMHTVRIILQKELEGALSTVCCQFDVRAYEQVQNAYGILGKTQVHIMYVYMHITVTVCASVRSIEWCQLKALIIITCTCTYKCKTLGAKSELFVVQTWLQHTTCTLTLLADSVWKSILMKLCSVQVQIVTSKKK